MYEVDDKDRVVPLPDVPHPVIGRGMPYLMCDHSTAIITYEVADFSACERKFHKQSGDEQAKRPQIATIRFERCYALMFGPPNDEAFAGHPLAGRGLEPYGAFIIENSSWLRRLERMNSVHSNHNPELFWRLRHFALTFKDDMFECIAHRFTLEANSDSIAELHRFFGRR